MRIRHFLLLLWASHSIAAEGELRLTAYNYPMLMSETELAAQRHGFVVDVVTAAAAAANLTLHIDYYPTKRALAEGKSARYAGSIGAIEQFSENEKQQLKALEITPIHLKLFYLTDNSGLPKGYKDLSEFKFWRVSAVLGSAALPLFEAAKLNYETSPEIDNCFGKLLRKRVDICAAVEIAAWDAMARSTIKAPVASYDKPLLTYHLSVNFNDRDDTKPLMERLQNGLSTIRQNQRYQAIVKHYYGENAPLELLQ